MVHLQFHTKMSKQGNKCSATLRPNSNSVVNDEPRPSSACKLHKHILIAKSILKGFKFIITNFYATLLKDVSSTTTASLVKTVGKDFELLSSPSFSSSAGNNFVSVISVRMFRHQLPQH